MISISPSFVWAANYSYNGKPFSVQGHRGAKALVGPGNTLADIRAAIYASVDSFEVDLRRTADQVIVLGHDEDISRTCNYAGSGRPSTTRISRMTFSEQQRWDCEPQNSGIQPYPTLAQLLDLHRVDDFAFNLEIKPRDRDTTDQIMNQLISYNANCQRCLSGRLRISSFEWDILRYAKANYESRIPFTIGAITARASSRNIQSAAVFADVYSPSFRSVSRSSVVSAQSLGMTVIPYTVNSTRDINRMLSLGVDGLITDNPNILAALINSERPNASLPSNLGPNLISNPSAEEPLTSNRWRRIRGGWQAGSTISAFDGDRVFVPEVDASGTAILEQTFLLPSGSTRNIYFQASIGSLSSRDLHRVTVEYLNGNGEIVFKFDTFTLNVPRDTWWKVRDLRVVPNSATSVRIRLVATRAAGSEAESYFDNLYLGIIN